MDEPRVPFLHVDIHPITTAIPAGGGEVSRGGPLQPRSSQLAREREWLAPNACSFRLQWKAAGERRTTELSC